MIGRPENRFEALRNIFSSAVAPLVKSVSNYVKNAAIYQLDLQGDESWSEVRATFKNKLLRIPDSSPH